MEIFSLADYSDMEKLMIWKNKINHDINFSYLAFVSPFSLSHVYIFFWIMATFCGDCCPLRFQLQIIRSAFKYFTLNCWHCIALMIFKIVIPQSTHLPSYKEKNLEKRVSHFYFITRLIYQRSMKIFRLW